MHLASGYTIFQCAHFSIEAWCTPSTYLVYGAGYFHILKGTACYKINVSACSTLMLLKKKTLAILNIYACQLQPAADK